MKKTEKRRVAKQNDSNKNNSKKGMMFKWRLKKLVLDFPESTKQELTTKLLIQTIIPRLQDHEGMELLNIMVGHPDHHTVQFDESSNPLGKKWLDQNKEFSSMGYEMLSFNIEGGKRLYGFIDGSIFYPIWYDHYHRLYPSKKKHS